MDALEAGAAEGLFTVFFPFRAVAGDAVGTFEATTLLTFGALFSPRVPFPAPFPIRTTAALLGFNLFDTGAALAAGAFFTCVFFFALFTLPAPFVLCALFETFATFFFVVFLIRLSAGESGARFLSFTAFRVPPAAAFFLLGAAVFVDFLARFIMRASRVGLGFTRNIPDPDDKNRKPSLETKSRSARPCR